MSGKILTGKVVSNKMQKTVVVAVEVPTKHPIYGKAIKNTRRLKAHSEKEVKVGDIVRIGETKPISKEVSFVVLEVLKEKG